MAHALVVVVLLLLSKLSLSTERQRPSTHRPPPPPVFGPQFKPCCYHRRWQWAAGAGGGVGGSQLVRCNINNTRRRCASTGHQTRQHLTRHCSKTKHKCLSLSLSLSFSLRDNFSSVDKFFSLHPTSECKKKIGVS